MTVEKTPPMVVAEAGHLGGYVKADLNWPHGDPLTYCPAVWDWLLDRFRPTTLLDVGCGEGHTVGYYRRAGVQALGIEGCPEAFQAKVVDPGWLIRHDYAEGPCSSEKLGPVDLVWCSEFVEHVEAIHAENFLLTFDLGQVVCMTHGFPGQPGYHHVNCRSAEEWIATMAARGFVLDPEATSRSREMDQPQGHWRRSGLIFRQASVEEAKS